MPFSVIPKRDCPHAHKAAQDVAQSLSAGAGAGATDIVLAARAIMDPRKRNACVKCGEVEDLNVFPETWLCAECGHIACSRYVKGHFAEHRENSEEGTHVVGISLADLSVWCFLCEEYIQNDLFTPVLQALAAAKLAVGTQLEQESRNDANLASGVSANGETTSESSSEDRSFNGTGESAPGSSSSESKVEKDGNSDGESTSSSDGDDLSIDTLAERLVTTNLADDINALRQRTILGDDLHIEGVAAAIREGKARKIIVMAGAGISVSAGIPDFRTPGTGLYDNLQKYNLPEPTAIFDISYYREKPEPFCLFAKEIYPGVFRPTLSHYFSRLLHDKNLLLRHFTQNIDTLERVAMMPDQLMVEAHGSFHAAHCIDCDTEADRETVRADYFADRIPRCIQCGGLVKPDIVFFGESLPARFFERAKEDFPHCDMLLVMGTSLQVQPFAGLIECVSEFCPRVLLNREPVATANKELLNLGSHHCRGFRFKHRKHNIRDVAILGDLDDVVWRLTRAIGDDWVKDLCALVETHEPEDSPTRQMLRQRLASEILAADSSSAN